MTLVGAKDQPITIAPIPGRVRVVWRGRTIGETTRALELKEAGREPIAYLPREDIEAALLERSQRVTACPIKGEAIYYAVTDGYDRDDCASWTYTAPEAEFAAIAGRLAFDPGVVRLVRTD